MRDREWRLVYPGVDLAFGPADAPIVHLAAPEISDPDIRDDDIVRPRQDGRAFGLDFLGGRTITFELGVLGDDEAEVRSRLAELARAWRADTVRLTPGALAELRVQHAGRQRVIYGRPRRLSTNESDISEGIAVVTADFVTADDVFYGAEEGLTVGLVPAAGGGLTGILAAPLSTTATSDRSAVIQINGDGGAWPVVTIYGPVTNPVVEVVGRWRLSLAAPIAANDAVTIDTRPWARTVLRQSGGSLAGAFTRSSVRLARTALDPGRYEVALRGSDSTGTARIGFAWRPTYSSL